MKKLILLSIPILLITSPTLAAEYGLEDLYKIGLERSERIKISVEDLFIAERGRDKAVSLLLPKLSAYGNYTKYTEAKYSSTGSVVQPETSKYWGLRLDHSFTISGRELTAFDISRDNIRRSRYDLHSVKEDYLFLISSAYYNVLRAKKALEIARANVERLIKHRDAAAIRLKVGEATKTVLLRAEAELSGAQSEEIRARNGLELAKAVLARVVGIENDYELKETHKSPVSSQEPFDLNILTADCRLPILDCLKQIALSERSDLKSFKLQKDIAEKQVIYTKGSFWPILSIEGVYHRKDDDPTSPFLKESIYGGLKLTFPFFEGGLRIAEVKEANAKMRQSIFALEDRRKAISIEVEDEYLNLITQKGIIEKFEAQVTFAEDNYKAISKQFEHGIANSIDVMDANTLLVTAERQLADARYNYQLAIVKLKRAMGTLLKEVLIQQSSVVGHNLEEK